MGSSPYVPTELPDALKRLMTAAERQRENNTGGYGSGVCVQIDGWMKKSTVTSCSPFTATTIGMIFDPDFMSKAAGDTYKPVAKRADGGTDPLPGLFYRLHNTAGKTAATPFEKKLINDHGADKAYGEVAPLEFWGLMQKIEPKKMRRGDFVAISWGPRPTGVIDPKTGKEKMSRGGHATFCWDVHLDANGDVDCFQYFTGNGSALGGGKFQGPGVTVGGCIKYLKYGAGKYNKTDTMFAKVADGGEYDEYVSDAHWNRIPGVDPTKIDKTTFRSKPKIITQPVFMMPESIQVARFYGYTPPEPYAQKKDGEAPPPKKKEEPHAKAKAVIVPVAEPVKKDAAPAEKPKEKPKEVEQKKDAPTSFQLEVEEGLQQLWKVKWIDVDPGTPDNVADAQSQAAIKDFQTKFGLEATGYADRKTRDMIKKAIGWTAYQHDVEVGLQKLFALGKLDKDPGVPNGINEAESRDAIKAFQAKHGLKADGIAGPKTRATVAKAIEDLKEPPAKAPVKPGQPEKKPTKPQLFFGTNYAKAGSTVEVRLHAPGVGDASPDYPVQLIECEGGKTYEAKRSTEGLDSVGQGDVLQIFIVLPPLLKDGTKLKAKIAGKLPDGAALDVTTPSELEVGSSTQTLEERRYDYFQKLVEESVKPNGVALSTLGKKFWEEIPGIYDSGKLLHVKPIEFTTAEGAVNVFGLRSVTSWETHEPRKWEHDDWFVICWLEGGKKRCKGWKGSVQPDSKYLSNLCDGQWRYKTSSFTPKMKTPPKDAPWPCGKQIGDVVWFNDHDHDGKRDADNKEEGYWKGNVSILIHRSSESDKNINGYSAGCQVVKYPDFNEFWAVIKKATNHDDFPYTLLDASRLKDAIPT
jgi:peptidoglycan hydrolase-like protein with peptidoglycan-binding domain